MNEIVNKLLLAGNKFMPEMHLKQPGFTYSACRSFKKKQKIIHKFKETGDSSYIYINELDKACFQHDMAYGDFKDLARRIASGKVKALRDKTFNIAKNPKYDEYQRWLATMVYKFFDKTSAGSVAIMQAKPNEQLAKELQKPIIRKFKERTVYSGFKDNIWGPDLADMQLISTFNKGLRFLLCFIDIFSKYAWIVPLKDKKGVTITNPFQKILEESNRKPKKIWVDKGN